MTDKPTVPPPEWEPTFGAVLRGYRLGFAWSQDYQCWIRLVGDEMRCRVDVRPAGLIPSPKRADHERHRVWWDRHDILFLIEDLPRAPQHATSFYVDGNGKRTKEQTAA